MDALSDVKLGTGRGATGSSVPKRACRDTKARQSSQIRQIGEALRAAGYLRLDEQARALGLSRSTTWTLLRGNHKGSGLTASVISRMLQAPGLPPAVRAKILEYVGAKSAGQYGHSSAQLRRFGSGLRQGSPGNASAKRTVRLK
jgi:predicted DNA-binding transcriptional regulator AlpA